MTEDPLANLHTAGQIKTIEKDEAGRKVLAAAKAAAERLEATHGWEGVSQKDACPVPRPHRRCIGHRPHPTALIGIPNRALSLGRDGYIYRDGPEKVYRENLMTYATPEDILALIPKLEMIG